jgi:hypothetical protein
VQKLAVIMKQKKEIKGQIFSYCVFKLRKVIVLIGKYGVMVEK